MMKPSAKTSIRSAITAFASAQSLCRPSLKCRQGPAQSVSPLRPLFAQHHALRTLAMMLHLHAVPAPTAGCCCPPPVRPSSPPTPVSRSTIALQSTAVLHVMQMHRHQIRQLPSSQSTSYKLPHLPGAQPRSTTDSQLAVQANRSVRTLRSHLARRHAQAARHH